MSWVKIDDQFSEHPKVIQAGPLASWLYVRGLCYSAKYLTDGFIPQSAAEHLAMFAGSSPELLGKLVECSLWERRNDGYQIHDYLDYNPTGAQVKAERAASAERMRQKREEKGMFARTSPELRPNFAESSSPPSPSPSPSPIIEESSVVISEEAPLIAAAPPKSKPKQAKTPKPPAEPAATPPPTDSETPVKVSRKSHANGEDLHHALFGKVAEVCGMDTGHLTRQAASQIAGAAKQLAQAGATTEGLDRFGAWWRRVDWRGKKGQTPTPPQVVIEWPKFSANGSKSGNSVLDRMIEEGLWQPGQPLSQS